MDIPKTARPLISKHAARHEPLQVVQAKPRLERLRHPRLVAHMLNLVKLKNFCLTSFRKLINDLLLAITKQPTGPLFLKTLEHAEDLCY